MSFGNSGHLIRGMMTPNNITEELCIWDGDRGPPTDQLPVLEKIGLMTALFSMATVIEIDRETRRTCFGYIEDGTIILGRITIPSCSSCKVMRVIMVGPLTLLFWRKKLHTSIWDEPLAQFATQSDITQNIYHYCLLIHHATYSYRMP